MTPRSRPKLDVAACRREFPALTRTVNGRPAVFLDGPGGSQVPARVAGAVARYLASMNANSGGAFATSVETDAMLAEAHRAAADFVGASDPGCVAFGANMTTLALSLARALARTWRSGDEVVVTRLEHDANVTPWVQAARDAGAAVRHAAIRRTDCTLDLDDLESKLAEQTRLVAVGCASNAVGTIAPVGEIVEMAHAYGAEVFLDAVHLAPHALLDVEAWGCDYLCCSAYKFFGPHVGVLYGKREKLEGLPAYKLRPSPEDLPHRWETGTQCHEGIAGTLEAIEYLADLGRRIARVPLPRREALREAYAAIREHERGLAARALEVLLAIPGVEVRGIADPDRLDERTPTFGFTHRRLAPAEVAARLADEGIFVWSGNFYALPLTEALGIEPGGLARAGFLHYNTLDEVERLGEALARL